MEKTLTPEQLCKEIVLRFFKKDDVIFNWRPDFLKNPKTGKNLEVDIFIKNKRLAIEINGIHHKTIYQIEKDNIKKKNLKKEKIRLIVIDDIKQINWLVGYFNWKNFLNQKEVEEIKLKIKNINKNYHSKSFRNSKYKKYFSWKIKNEKGIAKAMEAQRIERRDNVIRKRQRDKREEKRKRKQKKLSKKQSN